MAKRKPKSDALAATGGKDYERLLSGVAGLLDQARVATARVVNGVMTATYYELGRRIVEFEQGGKGRAGYGEEVIARLAADLTAKFGRGFSRSNLFQIRGFYLEWEIVQTVSGLFQVRAKPGASEQPQPPPAGLVPVESPVATAALFPLPWSHYVRLMTVPNLTARRFYEEEAIKGG